MMATARLVFNQDYFETSYDDWLRHRSKLRRYAVQMSLALLATGIALTLAFPHTWFFGAALACVGVYEFLEAITHKSRWIKARVKAVRPDKVVDMQLSESEITITSAAATGCLKVGGFLDITVATKGVFLVLDAGNSIYIPAETVTPRDAFRPLVNSWTAARESGHLGTENTNLH